MSNAKKLLFALLVIAALIILPLGPEDIITVPILISLLGLWGYIILVLLTLLAIIAFLPKRYRRKLRI